MSNLLSLEKQTRLAGDSSSTGQLLVQIVQFYFEFRQFDELNNCIVVLCKKRGQLKRAITVMIQKCMEFVDSMNEMDLKLSLIETLRTATEGKIFVEVERARLTMTLSKIQESSGKVKEAMMTLNELQVETFGSMEKREKTMFLIEQTRLCYAVQDYSQAQIVANKISVKVFENNENEDLKLQYYDLLVLLAVYRADFLDCCKFHLEIANTNLIQQDASKYLFALKLAIVFSILSPFGEEQIELKRKLSTNNKIESIPMYHELLTCFQRDELIRWPVIEDVYKSELVSLFVFDQSTEDGRKRWDFLRERITDHNIRVISFYYTQVSIPRLMVLLDSDQESVEKSLAKLVSNQTIYAKIDRPAGTVNFHQAKSPVTVINEWSNSINSLLKLVVETTHLIAKEEMTLNIQKKLK